VKFFFWIVPCLLIIGYGFSAEAINCDTNCVEEAKSCTKVRTHDFKTGNSIDKDVCVTTPGAVGVCAGIQIADCARKATIKDEMMHGIYCGLGRTDSSYQHAGIDALDSACKRHDKCYDKRGNFNCSCDRILSGEALASTPTLQGAAVVKAAATTAYFSASACIPP